METRINRRTLLAASAAAGIASAGLSSSVEAANPVWEPLSIDGSGPPARWDHHLTSDAEEGLLMLFGGRDAGGFAFADTWLYDVAAATWTQLDLPGPAARFGAAVTEDPVLRRVYLFSGEDRGTFYNDTWVFDFAEKTWTLLDDGSTIAPSPRYGLGAALDPDANLVISHGFTFEGRFDDTWVFDVASNTWSDISPPVESRPLKRCLHEMVREPESGEIILFGGCSSGFGPCPQGDLWAFDSTTSNWVNITPATGPTARSNPALVWAEDAGKAMLFGGQSDAGQVADLWEGAYADGVFTWTEVIAEGEIPLGRSSHDAVMLDGQMYLFGGTSPAGLLNDLWRLSLS